MDKVLREKLLEIGRAVLAEMAPERCLRRELAREGNVLRAGPVCFDLSRFRRAAVVGFGKAAAGMAQALEEMLGDLVSEGLVITAPGQTHVLKRIGVREASHPVPDERTLLASQELLELTRTLSPQDLLIVLVSGGGSALFELPPPPLSLADIQHVTELLWKSGATIVEMNVVRKHLSAVKGGGLLRHTTAGVVLSLVLSDVPGDDLSSVASGPTAADPSTFAQARAILERYHLWSLLPERVRAHILRGERGEEEETVKPGDHLLTKVTHVLVGSGTQAAEMAKILGEKAGFQAQILTTTLRGEAREVGRFLAALAEEEVRHGRPLSPPALFVLAGETTVTVRGEGKGGRNQELALAFAVEAEGREGTALLALATDGKDGPTDAAGALVDGETASRIRCLGLDPGRALAENDAYPTLLASGDLLRLGPTGTNVADLVLVGVERRRS